MKQRKWLETDCGEIAYTAWEVPTPTEVEGKEFYLIPDSRIVIGREGEKISFTHYRQPIENAKRIVQRCKTIEEANAEITKQRNDQDAEFKKHMEILDTVVEEIRAFQTELQLWNQYCVERTIHSDVEALNDFDKIKAEQEERSHARTARRVEEIMEELDD